MQTSKLIDKMGSVSARTKVVLVCKAETHRSRIAQLIIVQMYYYLGFSSFRFDMTPSATDNSILDPYAVKCCETTSIRLSMCHGFYYDLAE